MSRSEEYRRFAQECLEMVRSMDDERPRAILIQMAQVWFRLAQDQHVRDQYIRDQHAQDPHGDQSAEASVGSVDNDH